MTCAGLEMKVHAALAATLADHDVTTMFGVLGDGNMFLVESFAREQGGRYVAAANEAGAVLMAAGFASASGTVGVATVTHGPGLANTLGALLSTSREHMPIVVLTGAIAVRGHTQNVDQAALVSPTGAGFEQALSAKTAPAELGRALRRALAERRPIVFSVPVDFTFEDAEYAPTARQALPVSQGVRPADEAMDVAVGLIASSRRPIVLAGAGAISSTAPSSLRRLAEVLGAPLMTTLPAKGLFGYDKYDLGVFGSFSTPRAVDAIMASDCIVAVGASLSRLTGGGEGWAYFAGKRIVHCDINLRTMGSQYEADAPVAADATAFADAVVELLHEAEYTGTNFRNTIAAEDEPVIAAAKDDVARAESVDLATAMTTLNAALPAERSIAVDSGRFVSEAVQRLAVPRAQAWAHAGRGLGAVGNGLSTAVGIGCARPDAPVVAVVGDGAFMLGGLAEFNTAVRHCVDLTVVVCNDGSYGAEYRKLKARDVDVDVSLFQWPDFAPVAIALGGSGFTVRNMADLARIGDVIAQRDRPLLIDIKLEPEKVVG